MSDLVDPATGRAFGFELEKVGIETLAGWVAERGVATKLAVVLRVDGMPVRATLADLAHSRAPGDGFHGFAFRLPERWASAECWLGNVELQLGRTLSPSDPVVSLGCDAGVGEAVWKGGLVVSGWVRDDTPVEAWAGGRRLAVCTSLPLTYRPWGAVSEIVRSFEMTLPASLVDGRMHVIEIRSGQAVLSGSPVPLIVSPVAGS